MTNVLNNSAKISCIKFNGYKIDISVNLKGNPTAKLCKFITVGKNKNQYKIIEHFRFATEDRRKEWITEKMTNIKANIESTENYRKEKKEAISGHTFKVGEVLYQSWGYDQTNIDFYQIVSIGEKSVKVRSISQKMVNGTEGFMCENVTPDIDNFTGEVETKIVKCYISNLYNSEIRKPSYYVANGRHHLNLYNYGERGVYQSHYA